MIADPYYVLTQQFPSPELWGSMFDASTRQQGKERSPSGSVGRYTQRAMLSIVAVGAILFLIIHCSIKLTSLWNRRFTRALAEGGDHICMSPTPEPAPLPADLLQQKEVLSVTATALKGLTSEEVAHIDHAKEHLEKLMKDAYDARVAADGFALSVQEDKEELEKQLSELAEGAPLTESIILLQKDIAGDEQLLEKYRDTALEKLGAMAPAGYSPHQSTVAWIKLAAKHCNNVKISLGAAEALAAADTVLWGPPQPPGLPEVQVRDALVQISESSLQEMAGFGSDLRKCKSRSHLSKFWCLRASATEAVRQATTLVTALVRLGMEEHAMKVRRGHQQLQTDITAVTSSMVALEVHEKISAGHRRKKLWSLDVPAAIEAATGQCTQHLETACEKVRDALEKKDEPQHPAQLESLYLETAKLITEAHHLLPESIASEAKREAFETALKEATTEFDKLQKVLVGIWLGGIERRTLTLRAELNKLEAAIKGLQQTALEELVKEKLTDIERSVLYSTQKLNLLLPDVEKHVESLQVLFDASELPHGVKDRLNALAELRGSASKRVKTELGALAQRWQSYLKEQLKAVAEAKEKLASAGPKEESELLVLKQAVWKAEEKRGEATSKAISVELYLRTLGATYEQLKDLSRTIKDAGASILMTTPPPLLLKPQSDASVKAHKVKRSGSFSKLKRTVSSLSLQKKSQKGKLGKSKASSTLAMGSLDDFEDSLVSKSTTSLHEAGSTQFDFPGIASPTLSSWTLPGSSASLLTQYGAAKQEVLLSHPELTSSALTKYTPVEPLEEVGGPLEDPFGSVGSLLDAIAEAGGDEGVDEWADLEKSAAGEALHSPAHESLDSSYKPPHSTDSRTESPGTPFKSSSEASQKGAAEGKSPSGAHEGQKDTADSGKAPSSEKAKSKRKSLLSSFFKDRQKP
ncbi:hypothetical protein cyc_05216 [Cyclospora cayetanensis]|uniref:Uncharacterized protein n=1 Tax=Cyclospora cayetanensis TaxID=88456 RepID=A0A1D3CRN7_9EIME|nr:hypothetical protein cyc_05216 [Cyclospora cayetanensis]